MNVPTISSLTACHRIPRLEAELFLSRVLRVDRTYLYAYPEQILTHSEYNAFEAMVERHLVGEPVAYILGKKSFWSFELNVTPDTLIPRPETELLVELALLNLSAQPSLRVADLGTGSGAIAIALALERPNWHITATDISEKALSVARENAAQLNCPHISFYQGQWCDALPEKAYDAIISNPPYIAKNDPDIEASVRQFEPHSALFAEKNGLEDLKKIIEQARDYLTEGGILLLEHGASMANEVIELLTQNHYTRVCNYLDLAGKPRVTLGRVLGKV